MNLLIQLKQTTSVFVVAFALACFGLSTAVQAVSPAPDGGYPNFTTAEGDKALFSLSTGAGNTGLGWHSLFLDATGSFNTAVGVGTLVLNTADQNTAIGVGALLSNTTGPINTANGALALFHNTTGNANTAIGYQALFNNTNAGVNTAVGSQALESNMLGNLNTAIGGGALASSINGLNTAVGAGALALSTGVGNTALGESAGGNVNTANNVIAIGTLGADVSNSCFIGNIRGTTTTQNDAIPVLIDSAGQLGTASSSRRYKTDIKPMDKASECLLGLKPVSFRYKVHKDITPQFGLIAEQVAEVNPDLVIYDADGKPYTVRYDAVNAMLLNEFLKEHKAFVEEQRKVQEQGAMITRQQQQIEALTAGLQKVNAQLEVRKAAPQTALNNQ